MVGLQEMEAAAAKSSIPTTPQGTVDYSQDFFGEKAFLTVSGQLNGEGRQQGWCDGRMMGEGSRQPGGHARGGAVLLQHTTNHDQGSAAPHLCVLLSRPLSNQRLLTLGASSFY